MPGMTAPCVYMYILAGDTARTRKKTARAACLLEASGSASVPEAAVRASASSSNSERRGQSSRVWSATKSHPIVPAPGGRGGQLCRCQAGALSTCVRGPRQQLRPTFLARDAQ